MLIFFVVLVTWAGYRGLHRGKVAGATCARTDRESQEKTYEGLAGGIVLACLAAVVARAWFLPRFSLVDCLALGLLLTIAALIGDLAESAMKRHARV